MSKKLTNSMNECPCIDCLLIPICRHKRYLELFQDCSLLRIYEPNYTKSVKRSKDRIQIIKDHIHSTIWRTSYSDRWSFVIREDNNE